MKATATTVIRFGLINLPVQVFKATETGTDVKLNFGDEEGKPVSQVYVKEGTSEIVPRNKMTKVLNEAGESCIIDPEALKAIAERTKLPDLSVLDVIPREDFVKEQFRTTDMHFIEPHKKLCPPAQFKLFVEALEQSGKVLVTKWTPRSRQALMVLWPKGGTLMASTLCFESDVRTPNQTHLEAEYNPAELDMAIQLLDAMSGISNNSLSTEVDEAVPLRHALIEEARKGEKIAPVPEAAKEEPVTALAGALEQMLAAAKAKAAA